MTFKFFLKSSNGDTGSFIAFVDDQDYISYLKLFKEDFSNYERVNVYKLINGKLIYIEKLLIESL